MFLGLPDYCYARNPTTGDWIIILKGKRGYFTMDWGKTTDDEVDARNAALGISTGQKLAMLAGATTGWRTPTANPAFYDQHHYA